MARKFKILMLCPTVQTSAPPPDKSEPRPMTYSSISYLEGALKFLGNSLLPVSFFLIFPFFWFFSFPDFWQIFRCQRWHSTPRVFSLNFWWMGGGDSKIFHPREVDGETCENNQTEAETAHLMQNQAIFCYFKHEIQLFKVLLSLKLIKIVKFDTKIYLNFSNFWGWTSAGGGQTLVQKWGQVSNGGIDKIFTRWGTPQSPHEKTLPTTDPPAGLNQKYYFLVVKWKPIYFSLGSG